MDKRTPASPSCLLPPAVFILMAALFVEYPAASAADNTASGSSASQTKNAGKPKKPHEQFLRITEDKAGNPLAMEVAIVRYGKPPRGNGSTAVAVDLVGAVHLGEPEYYDRLNEEFKSYDDVLFELVAPKNVVVPKNAASKNRHPLAAVQNMMTDILELEYQLDGVDYAAENFVHADMSPEQFNKSMKDRGESFFAIFLRAMGYAMTRPDAGGSGMGDARLLMALFDKNRSLALKRIMARQFQDMGGVMAIFNGPDGSTLITERNKVALEALRRRLAAGSKKVAIFYGAGHMPDMAERLEKDFGLERTSTRWLTAWDLSDCK